MGRTAPRLSWKKKLAFTVVLLLMVYLPAEAYWYYRQRQCGPLQWQHWYLPHGLVRFRLKPGLDVSASVSRYKTEVRTNALGYRGRSIAVTKPRNTVRIICLGASTTFGTRVSDDEHTYPAVLERELSKAHPGTRFEVLNAGVPGYTTTNSLVHLCTRLVYLEPDIVIIYHAVNDLRDNRLYGPEVAPFDILGKPWQDQTLRWYVRNSLLGTGLARAKDLLTGSGAEVARPGAPFAVSERGLEVYRNNLVTMANVCHQHGVVPVVVKFPYPDDLGRRWVSDPLYGGMNGPQLAAGLAAYNAMVVTELPAKGIRVVSNSPTDSALFGDHCHYNDEGCVALAAVLLPVLGPIVHAESGLQSGSK